jgi:hypothetical protein
MLGHLLHENVARTFEGGFGVGHVRAEVAGGLGLRVPALRQQAGGQRFQAVLARDLALGPPLGPVGQVEVFELGLGGGGRDPRRQLVGELALGLDRAADGLAPRVELAQIGEPLLQLAQLGVIQAAGRFLAVAGDEGDGGALVQERDRGPDLLGPGADLLGDDTDDLVER